MSETNPVTLSGVPETLLITLYLRAMESQRPDALIHDQAAVALVDRMSYDFDRIRQIPLNEGNKLVIILRNREFDRYTQDFLARHPKAAVVHMACGLDSRFERVDNGQVEWYDLDLPDVIELRRKLLGSDGERYHLVGCSALDEAWLEAVEAHRRRPLLFLAEGLSMYLEEPQNKSLVRMLQDHFPGAELIFDAYSPVHLRVHNLQTQGSKLSMRAHWGIWHGQEIEKWGAGIRLLDEWGFMDRPEPRLGHWRWLRPFDSLFRTLRIYHFQLGKAAG